MLRTSNEAFSGNRAPPVPNVSIQSEFGGLQEGLKTLHQEIDQLINVLSPVMRSTNGPEDVGPARMPSDDNASPLYKAINEENARLYEAIYRLQHVRALIEIG